MDEFFNHFTKEVGLTWEELRQAPFEYLTKDEWRSYYASTSSRTKTESRGLQHALKKLEVYLELITLAKTESPSARQLPPTSKDYDPALLLEPVEAPTGKSPEYPLIYTGGRVPFFHHSTGRNIPALREIYPVPELTIHPQDAEKYGVSDGDWVWVESPRGRTRGKAKVSECIMPGVVHMERFWTPETLNTETHGWKEMNVNLLTSASAPYNDVVGTYTLRGFQVKVYKAEGPPEGVWQKPEEFKKWLPLPEKEVR